MADYSATPHHRQARLHTRQLMLNSPNPYHDLTPFGAMLGRQRIWEKKFRHCPALLISSRPAWRWSAVYHHLELALCGWCWMGWAVIEWGTGPVWCSWIAWSTLHHSSHCTKPRRQCLPVIQWIRVTSWKALLCLVQSILSDNITRRFELFC